jgi:hypothetical protein
MDPTVACLESGGFEPPCLTVRFGYVTAEQVAENLDRGRDGATFPFGAIFAFFRTLFSRALASQLLVEIAPVLSESKFDH